MTREQAHDDDAKGIELRDAMHDAIAAVMRHAHGDDTLVLTGFVMQAQASSFQSDETKLSTIGFPDQSMVVGMGLLAYLDYNVSSQAFDDA